MDFMSVHAAKGLEADNVIILNCSQDRGGFPSRIADDPILGYVLSEIESFEYSEERRLFYVAITRAKKHTWVLYNKQMPSTFVLEMTEQANTAAYLPLGLPATDPFWASPATDWTAKKAWNNVDVGTDHAIR